MATLRYYPAIDDSTKTGFIIEATSEHEVIKRIEEKNKAVNPDFDLELNDDGPFFWMGCYKPSRKQAQEFIDGPIFQSMIKKNHENLTES